MEPGEIKLENFQIFGFDTGTLTMTFTTRRMSRKTLNDAIIIEYEYDLASAFVSALDEMADKMPSIEDEPRRGSANKAYPLGRDLWDSDGRRPGESAIKGPKL